MGGRGTTTRGRVALVLVVAAGLAAAAVALALAANASLAGVRAAGPAPLDDVVVGIAAAVGALMAAWLAVGTVVSVVDLLRPTRRGRVPAPRLLTPGLHHLVALGLGVALLGVAVPSATTASVPLTAGSSTGPGVEAPDPGWAPAPRDSADAPTEPGWAPSPPAPAVRTAAPADPLVVAPPRPGTAAEDAVTVRRGDTLWDIAARHLPQGATDAEIAAAWPRWYEANSSTIGDDPDLILPGQRLVAPGDAPH